MKHYLIAAALIFASIVLYITGQQGYAALMIGGLVLEMAAVMIATRSDKGPSN